MPESKPSMMRAESAGAATQAAPTTSKARGEKPYATLTIDFYDDRGIEVAITGDRPLAMSSFNRIRSRLYKLIRTQQRALGAANMKEQQEAADKEAARVAKEAAAETAKEKADKEESIRKDNEERVEKAAAADFSRGRSTGKSTKK